jgi:2-polyprenyl-3-methyl-5-hydroxy-6-metoxy-1,4-benzoquinol methylase
LKTPYFDKYQRKLAYHWSDYFGGFWRMNAYTRARYKLVLECARAAKLPAGARILEVGCGDGALLGVLFIELGVTVCGVDTSKEGLALARKMFADKRLVGEFRQTKGYNTGFPDCNFDLVVCSEVIEHVKNPEEMLAEIRRILTPGGRLIITTPIKILEHPADPLHVQEWFVNEFKSLCRKYFGNPKKCISSHPLFWYELVSSHNPWIVRAGRLITNVLTRLGHNPFLERQGFWRCYTTQTLVLEKTTDGAKKHP